MRTVQWILLAVAGTGVIWELLTDRRLPRLQRPSVWLFAALVILTVLPLNGADRAGVWEAMPYVSMACSGVAITLMGRQVIRDWRARRAGGVAS